MVATSQLDFQVKDNGKQLTGFLDSVTTSVKKTTDGFKNLFSPNLVSNTTAFTKKSQDLDLGLKTLLKTNESLVKSMGGLSALVTKGIFVAGTIGNISDAKDALGVFNQTIGKTILALSGIEDLDKTLNLVRAAGVSTESIDQMQQLQELFHGNIQAASQFAQTATAAFNEYETQLTRVNTLLKVGQKDLQQQGQEIKDVVKKELKNSVTEAEALSGQYEVLSGGYQAADAQKVLAAGLKLSTIGMSDQGETLRLLVKTMQAYKINTADAGKTAAILNSVVEQGITTIPELTQGFGQTASVAKEAGIKIEELAASVALLTTKGTSTAPALTGIEGLSSVIIDKTPEASKALAELRDQAGKPIKFDVAEIKAKGLVGALRDLNVAIGGNAQVLSQIIPESRAYSTALALMSNNVKDLETVTVNVGQATAESLEKVFGISLGNKTQKFTQIVNRFGETMIRFGEAIAPAFQKGVDLLDQISELFLNMPDWIKDSIVSVVLGGMAVQKTTEIVNSWAGALFKVATAYLSQRALTLLLNGELFAEVEIVKKLITAKAGLVPVIKQILGFNQEALLVQKNAVETAQGEIKSAGAITEAIEKEIAVKKTRSALAKAEGSAEEAAEALKQSSSKVAEIQGVQNELLVEQQKARKVLLDSASSYEEKLKATNELTHIEEALLKNNGALLKAKKEDSKKLQEADLKYIEQQKAAQNVAVAEDNAAKVLEKRVVARQLDEKAAIAQTVAIQAQSAVTDIDNSTKELGIIVEEQRTIAKTKGAKAAALLAAAEEAEAAAAKSSLTFGAEHAIVTKANAEATELRIAAEIALKETEEANIVVGAAQAGIDDLSIKRKETLVLAAEAQKVAEIATTESKVAGIAAKKLELALDRDRLVASGNLIKTQIFGNTVYASATLPLIGQINKFLTQEVVLKRTGGLANLFAATTTGVLAAAQSGLATVFGLVSTAATAAWTAITGPLAPIIIAVAAVAAGVAVLFKTFQNVSSTNQIADQFKDINKELDTNTAKLSDSSKSWKIYSKELDKKDAFSNIVSGITDFAKNVSDIFKRTIEPVSIFLSKIGDGWNSFWNNVYKALGPFGEVLKKIMNPLSTIGELLENFNLNGMQTVIEETGEAIRTTQEVTTAATKTTVEYANGIYQAAENQLKLKNGIALTVQDMEKENTVYAERKKALDDNIKANDRRLEQLDDQIAKEGKSDRGKVLQGERDQLAAVNEQQKTRLRLMDEAKVKLDAYTEARQKAEKNRQVNANELVSPEALESAKKASDVVKASVTDSFKTIGVELKNTNKKFSELTDKEVGEFSADLAKKSSLVADGLLGISAAVTKSGLDVNRVKTEQLKTIKEAADTGSITKLNDALSQAAKESGQEFTELSASQSDSLLQLYKNTDEAAAKINKDTLTNQAKQFSDVTKDYNTLTRKAAATLEEDIGAGAFQTAARKSLRNAATDFKDYMSQYSAIVNNQTDAQGKLYYTTAENQKKYATDVAAVEKKYADLKTKDVGEYNKKVDEESQALLAKYKSEVSLTADQVKAGYSAKLSALIEQGNAALDAGGYGADEIAAKIQEAREQIKTLGTQTPQEIKQISDAILDLEKAGVDQRTALMEADISRYTAEGDAKIQRTEDVEAKVTEIQAKESQERLVLKGKEISELYSQGMIKQAEQAEKEFTNLMIGEIKARGNAASAEVAKNASEEKRNLDYKNKLLEASTSVEINSLQNRNKFTQGAQEAAKNEQQITEKNTKLTEAKFALEEMNLNIQLQQNKAALDAQKLQVDTNKLALEATAIKLRATVADPQATADQKKVAQDQLNAIDKQKTLLDEQSKSLKQAAGDQEKMANASKAELAARKQIAKENSAVEKQMAAQKVLEAAIQDRVSLVQKESSAIESQINVIQKRIQLEQDVTASKIKAANAENDADMNSLTNLTKLTQSQIVASTVRVINAQKSAENQNRELENERKSLIAKGKTLELEGKRAILAAKTTALQIDLEKTKLEFELKSGKVSPERKAMIEEELGFIDQRKASAVEEAKLAQENITAQKEILGNEMQALDAKARQTKENQEIEAIVAKQEQEFARINEVVEKTNKLFQDRKGVLDELKSTTESEYNLAIDGATSDAAKRKLQKEAAIEKKNILIVQQKIEERMFELQELQNKAALKRLKVETELVKIKAAQTGNKEAIEASIEAGKLVDKEIESTEKLAKFKKLNFQAKQRAELGQADSEIAKTTLSKSDDRKVGREAKARARQDRDLLLAEANSFGEDVDKDRSTSSLKATDTETKKQMQLTTVLQKNAALKKEVTGNIPGGADINSPSINAPGNAFGSSNISGGNNNNGSANVRQEIQAPINVTINIEAAPNQGIEPQKLGSMVRDEVVKSLTDVFDKAASLGSSN